MINTILLKLAALSLRNALVFSVAAGVLFFNSGFYDDGTKWDRDLAALKTKIAEQESKAAESDAALKEVDRVRRSVGALEEQFKLVAQQLPTEINMPDVLRSVDMLARSASVSVKDKEPKPTSKQDFLEIYPMRIRAEGSYSELTMFIYYLASTQRITRVRNFTMNLMTGPGKGNRLSFDGEVISYRFLPPPEEVKPADGATAKGGAK